MSLAGDVTGDAVYKIFWKIGDGNIELSPHAIATVAGILLNIIILKKRNRSIKSTNNN